uniref:Diacylglycerol kinase n=1 Tax=uncultured bacterium pAG2 TaxID=1781152 RepID=A0A1C9U4J7_9BACT|nr:diacylglycerol kinase [uncultured bacterium pAG2]
MRTIVIIANRGAGSFSQQRFDSNCSKLETKGVAVQRCFCTDFAEMTEKAGEISRQPDSPVVVAAGGDGTINAILNGLAGNRATCAILPMGTANVMALELGIRNTGMALATIVSGQPQPFTAGLLQNGSRSSRFFLMAGAGFDGHIVRGVSPREKQLLGKGAYLFSALRSFVSWDSGELQVSTEAEEFSCGSLIVCNASRYGGSFSLAPAANIFSPSFEVIAIRQSSRSAAIEAIANAALGRSHPMGTHRTTATRISVTGLKPVQADGDDWGDAPVKILAEPDYARILL